MTTSVEQGHDSSDPIYDSMPPEDPRPEYRDPPRFTLAGAVRRHWLLTLVPGRAAAAIGVFAGHCKEPTYSATATVNVGKSDINTQATPGYLVAAEALASSYSRLVQSQHIAVPAAKKVGETPRRPAAQLTAAPIPRSRRSRSRPPGPPRPGPRPWPTRRSPRSRGTSPRPPARAAAPPSCWRTQGSSTALSLEAELKLQAHAAPLDTVRGAVRQPDTDTRPEPRSADQLRQGGGADGPASGPVADRPVRQPGAKGSPPRSTCSSPPRA